LLTFSSHSVWGAPLGWTVDQHDEGDDHDDDDDDDDDANDLDPGG